MYPLEASSGVGIAGHVLGRADVAMLENGTLERGAVIVVVVAVDTTGVAGTVVGTRVVEATLTG